MTSAAPPRLASDQATIPVRRGLARGAGLLALAASCTTPPLGSSDANLERAKNEAHFGAGLFETQCAHCHGSRGQGMGGNPQVIGAGALPRHPLEGAIDQSFYSGDSQHGVQHPPGAMEGRPEFVTAEDLQRYLAYHMPKLKLQPLTDQDYWAIVQFMLIAHGSAVPARGISPENAAQVAIQ